MHVTVLVLDGFLPDGSDAAARFADLRTIIGSYPSFDLTLRGLNVSPATLFAQVIPHDRTFGRLRGRLRRLAKRSASQPGSVSSFGGAVRDLLPHANIVRFSGGVTPNFLEEVSRYRQVRIGSWTVREVELVRSDRDRKSTRLNSSHANISYAVFCLKKNNFASSAWATRA